MLIVLKEAPGTKPRICMLGQYARERVAFGWRWRCYGAVSTGFGKTPTEAYSNWHRQNPVDPELEAARRRVLAGLTMGRWGDE